MNVQSNLLEQVECFKRNDKIAYIYKLVSVRRCVDDFMERLSHIKAISFSFKILKSFFEVENEKACRKYVE